MKTKVVFRKFKDNNDIIALFPEDVWDHEGNCASYMRVGQHGGADYRGLVYSGTVKATPKEYRALRQELENIGYDLKVIERYTRPR